MYLLIFDLLSLTNLQFLQDRSVGEETFHKGSRLWISVRLKLKNFQAKPNSQPFCGTFQIFCAGQSISTTNWSVHTIKDLFTCTTDFISRNAWTSANSVITYARVEDLGSELGSLDAGTGVFTAPAAGWMLCLEILVCYEFVWSLLWNLSLTGWVRW